MTNTHRGTIRAALFDFDGTLSTLRYGWESIMRPLMIEMIGNGQPLDECWTNEVDTYIDRSTGIQTIFQMKWLAEAVVRYGAGVPKDPWAYKEEYNRRLMRRVDERKLSLLSGATHRERYLIAGADAFLDGLHQRGIQLFAASGTDHPDVMAEAEALGLARHFKRIEGAPPGREDCSKEAVMRSLLTDLGLRGCELMVVGDGRVEIEIAKQNGAWAIGVASDEEKGRGFNPVKRARLEKAGADLIISDFEDAQAVLQWIDGRTDEHV